MTEAELRTRPSPRTVADVVDSCGMAFARERWGSLGYAGIHALAEAGRRVAGRDRPRGSLHASAAHVYLNRAWDGLQPDRLDRPSAAAALGRSEASLAMGNA